MTLVRSLSSAVFLLATHDAFDHRVDQLEMAGVGAQADVDAAVLAGGAVVGIAEVVLDVAIALAVLGAIVPCKFADQHFVGLVEHMGQHVEPAAVGHAHADFLHADPRAPSSTSTLSIGISDSAPSRLNRLVD